MAKITDHITARPGVSANYLQRRGQEIYDGALEHAASGKTFSCIAEALHMSPSTLRAICRDDPTFSCQLADEMESASTMVLDELRAVPYTEPDPARARVRLDALKTYLSLKWPRLYGNRLDVTVRTLDMGRALELARQRAAERRQPIDVTGKAERLSADSVSVDDPQAIDPAFLALLE